MKKILAILLIVGGTAFAIARSKKKDDPTDPGNGGTGTGNTGNGGTGNGGTGNGGTDTSGYFKLLEWGRDTNDSFIFDDMALQYMNLAKSSKGKLYQTTKAFNEYDEKNKIWIQLPTGFKFRSYPGIYKQGAPVAVYFDVNKKIWFPILLSNLKEVAEGATASDNGNTATGSGNGTVITVSGFNEDFDY